MSCITKNVTLAISPRLNAILVETTAKQILDDLEDVRLFSNGFVGAKPDFNVVGTMTIIEMSPLALPRR